MSIIGGALAGGGEALEKSGLKLQDKFAQEDLQRMKTEADKELQASMQAFHRGENELSRELTRSEGAAGRRVTQEEGAATRGHQTELQKSMQGFTQAENFLNRQLQVTLAETHENAANARHRQSIGVQMAQLKATNEQVSIVPQDDGTLLKISKDGKNVGFVTDPVSGEKIKGKGISDATKILMSGNEKIMAALEVAAAKDTTPPEDRVALTKKIAFYADENKRLAGMKVDAPAAEAGAKWDNSTGDVMLDGKKIGTAKDAVAARALVEQARKGGSAEVKPKKSGIVGNQVSYGEALDIASPRKPRTPMTEEERARFSTPEG